MATTCPAADVLSVTASNPEVSKVLEKALRADTNKLSEWSKKPGKSGADLNRFCTEYEMDYLKAFFSALAEYKSHIASAHAALSLAGQHVFYTTSSLGEADEAYRKVMSAQGNAAGGPAAPGFAEYVAAMRGKAEAIRNLYLLMSFRPTSEEALRALLNEAKASAEFADPDPAAKEILAALDKHLRALSSPAPQRVRVSQPVSSCYRVATVAPRYPISQRSAGIQGTAVMRVIIGVTGLVAQLEPISGGPEFTVAAAESVRQWTYRPYYLNGKPVEVETQVTIHFELR